MKVYEFVKDSIGGAVYGDSYILYFHIPDASVIPVHEMVAPVSVMLDLVTAG